MFWATLGTGTVMSVLALAVLSSVLPYVLDQLVLRMVGRARFALLLALLPVAAVLAGLVMLGQVPARPELFGIALVVAQLDKTIKSPDDAKDSEKKDDDTGQDGPAGA